MIEPDVNEIIDFPIKLKAIASAWCFFATFDDDKIKCHAHQSKRFTLMW